MNDIPKNDEEETNAVTPPDRPTQFLAKNEDSKTKDLI